MDPWSLTRADLEVQSGQIESLPASGLRLRSAMTRAVLTRRDTVALELSFVYRGPTREFAPLASGEPRRQIGLELRAQNTCNVVYAMWHIAPGQGLHVSVKLNPEQSNHSQCRDAGYVTLTPDFVVAHLAPIVEGQRREMAAEIRGDRLDLWIDGGLAWSARLPPEALQLQGPFGLRSDNAAFDVQLSGHQTSLRAAPPERAE